MYNVLLSDNGVLASLIARKCRPYGHAHRVITPLADYDTAYSLNSGYKKIGVLVTHNANNRSLAKAVYIGRRYQGRVMFINNPPNDLFDVIQETFKPCSRVLFFSSPDAYVDFMKKQAVSVPEGKCLLPPYKPLLDKSVCTVCRRTTCPKIIKRKRKGV